MQKLFSLILKLLKWIIFEFRYDPRTQIGLILFGISLISIFSNPSAEIGIKFLTAIFSAALIDALFLKSSKHKWLFPHSSLITGSLVFLILNPNFSSWLFPFTSGVAILVKHFLVINKRHIFNPAASGLFFISLFLPGAITWWGVSSSVLYSLPIVIGAGWVLLRIKRILLPITFLLVYILILVITGKLSSIYQFIDPTLFLFAFIMLSEPQTSPINGYWRFGFGPLVASILTILVFLKINVSDHFLASLLIANAGAVVLKNLSIWSKKLN